MEATSKLVLKDFSAYAKMVSAAYLARPKFEPEHVKSWKVLMQNMQVLYKRLQSQFTFEYTAEDPYKTFDQMRDDVVQTGVLRIYTGHSHHPVWTKEENWIFRSVHDAAGHLAGYKKGKGAKFTLRGELAVYNRHVKTISPDARLALFTEIIGQVCTQTMLGTFPPQKVCALHGFDYVQIGKIDDALYQTNFGQEDADMPIAANFGTQVRARYSVVAEGKAKWRALTPAEVAQEYAWEYDKVDRHFPESFPTLEAFKGAINDGKVQSLTKAQDAKVSNRSHCRTIAELKKLTSTYRFPRDVDRIVKGIEEGHEMPYPILLKKGSKLHVMSGNTRLDVASILGVTPKVIIIEVA